MKLECESMTKHVSRLSAEVLADNVKESVHGQDIASSLWSVHLSMFPARFVVSG